MATSPPALRRGDTIAFVSPSARLNTIFPLRVARAQAFLETQGFVVKEIFNSSKFDSFSAEVAIRAGELHAAFEDASVRAIVCCIGGLTANELVPALDYDLIRRNPKIFIGSSDITLLHHALFAGAGLRTYYGPSAITQLAEYPEPLAFTWQHFSHVLMNPARETVGSMPRSPDWTEEFLDFGGEPANVRARQMRPSPDWKWLRPGRAEGRIWGGCVPSVLQLFGSRWQVDYRGKILLLELPEGDAPGTPYSVEQACWNLADLRMKGVLDQVVGLVLGRPYMHREEDTVKWERAVMRLAEGYEFPILANVDVGHTDPMLTVPLDLKCRIDSAKDEWVLLEQAVVERKD